MIRFLQTNLNNCRAAQDLLSQTEREYRIDMTLISEPHRIPNDSTWVASTNGTAGIHWNADGHMSSCLLKKQGRFSVMVQWRDLTVISCYISPNVDDGIYEEFLDELDNNIMEAHGCDIILGSDFNSKSILWGCPYTNSRGDRLECWYASRDLLVVNSGNQPTCTRPQGSSIIDVTWSSPYIKPRIAWWKVMDLESLSDHKYINFAIHVDKRIRTVHHKKRYVRWAHKKLDEECFKKALEWCCTNRVREININQMVQWVNDVLTDACNYSMPDPHTQIKCVLVE